MKKIITMMLFPLVLVACDNSGASKQVVQPVEKKESAKFECSNGGVSTKCDIVAGDQLGSGKWRHAKLNMSGSDASLNIDGEVFYKTDVSSDFIDGRRVATFELKSQKNSRAEVSISSSNSESHLSVNAWNSDEKLMMTSSR